MRRAFIGLLISIGLLIVGSAVCFPGLGGCGHWLPLENPDKFGLPFAILSTIGSLGIIVCILWFIIAAVISGYKRFAKSEKLG
jgi:hypothetical protein